MLSVRYVRCLGQDLRHEISEISARAFDEEGVHAPVFAVFFVATKTNYRSLVPEFVKQSSSGFCSIHELHIVVLIHK